MTFFRRIENLFIIALFALIFFFPQGIEDRYWLDVRLCMGVFLCAAVLINQQTKKIFSSKDWPLGIFLACLGLNIFTAQNTPLAAQTYFKLSTTLVLMYFIGKYFADHRHETDLIPKIVSLFSCVIALIGIVEINVGRNILYENFINNPFYERYSLQFPRPMSTQLNPAVLGSVLLGGLPFHFVLMKNRQGVTRWLAMISFMVTSVVIFLTFSRGVFLGLAALIVFYLWQRRRKKLVLWLLAALAIFIFICSFSSEENIMRFGFRRLIAGDYDAVLSQYRLDRIKMGFAMLRDHPLLGIGLNHFRLMFEYYSPYAITEMFEFRIPDNMYLSLLSETGLISFGAFLFFTYSLIKNGLDKLRRPLNNPDQTAVLIPLSALVGLLVNMGAYDLFYWSNPCMLFGLWCGLIRGSESLSDDQRVSA